MGRGPVISAKEIDWHLKITASLLLEEHKKDDAEKPKRSKDGQN